MSGEQFVFQQPENDSLQQNGGGIYHILRTTDFAEMSGGGQNNQEIQYLNGQGTVNQQTQGEEEWGMLNN